MWFRYFPLWLKVMSSLQPRNLTVRTYSPTGLQQLEEFECPPAARDRIRGTGEAHPICRSVHVCMARRCHSSAIYSNDKCHFDLFSVDKVCVSVSPLITLQARCPTFVPSCPLCHYKVTWLLQPEAFVWRVNYGWVMSVSLQKQLYKPVHAPVLAQKVSDLF